MKLPTKFKLPTNFSLPPNMSKKMFLIFVFIGILVIGMIATILFSFFSKTRSTRLPSSVDLASSADNTTCPSGTDFDYPNELACVFYCSVGACFPDDQGQTRCCDHPDTIDQLSTTPIPLPGEVCSVGEGFICNNLQIAYSCTRGIWQQNSAASNLCCQAPDARCRLIGDTIYGEICSTDSKWQITNGQTQLCQDGIAQAATLGSTISSLTRSLTNPFKNFNLTGQPNTSSKETSCNQGEKFWCSADKAYSCTDDQADPLSDHLCCQKISNLRCRQIEDQVYGEVCGSNNKWQTHNDVTKQCQSQEFSPNIDQSIGSSPGALANSQTPDSDPTLLTAASRILLNNALGEYLASTLSRSGSGGTGGGSGTGDGSGDSQTPYVLTMDDYLSKRQSTVDLLSNLGECGSGDTNCSVQQSELIDELNKLDTVFQVECDLGVISLSDCNNVDQSERLTQGYQALGGTCTNDEQCASNTCGSSFHSGLNECIPSVSRVFESSGCRASDIGYCLCVEHYSLGYCSSVSSKPEDSSVCPVGFYPSGCNPTPSF